MEDTLAGASCQVWRGTVFRACKSVILSRLFKLVTYVSRRNVSLEDIVFNSTFTGQVKITLKVPDIKTFLKF